MAIQVKTTDYEVEGRPYQGALVWDDTLSGPRPTVLVCHTWAGQGDFEIGKCKALAELGYVAFAVDVYGKGVRGTTPEQNAQLLQPLLDDRAELQARLQGSLTAVRDMDQVDEGNIAAIGFCFGGLCALDIARSGTDIPGVVSFHGLLGAPQESTSEPVRARVLVLHGWDDPMATPDAVLALAQELTTAGADWQVHAYGGTVHAFTNPAANAPESGTVYDPQADRRSFAAMQNFLGELFA